MCYALDIPEDCLVTIVIPCYEHAHFLGQAIESALAQTYKPIEVIVVDDGSKDDTAAVAATYPVQYIKQENAGPSAARNTGIRASRGSYLVFLDADDRLTPDAVKIGVECLAQHPDWAFVFGRVRQIDEHGGSATPRKYSLITRALLYLILPRPKNDSTDCYEVLLRGNRVGAVGTVLYRRSAFDAVGMLDAELRTAEDYELYLRICRRLPAGRHSQIIAEYRRHSTNTTLDYSQVFRDTINVLERQWDPVQFRPNYRRALRAGVLAYSIVYTERSIRARKFRPILSELSAPARLFLRTFWPPARSSRVVGAGKPLKGA